MPRRSRALGSGEAGLSFRIAGVPLRRAIFINILRSGGVAWANAFLTIMIVTALVGRYGTTVLAGYGVGSRASS